MATRCAAQAQEHAPPAELPSRLGQLGGELTRLVPELTELVAGLPSPMRADPGTERYRRFEASPAHLLVVGSYRHTELDPARSVANLLADLRRAPGMERLVLEGLDEAEDGVAGGNRPFPCGTARRTTPA